MPILNEGTTVSLVRKGQCGIHYNQREMNASSLGYGSKHQHDYPRMCGGPLTPNGASHRFA